MRNNQMVTGSSHRPTPRFPDRRIVIPQLVSFTDVVTDMLLRAKPADQADDLPEAHATFYDDQA